MSWSQADDIDTTTAEGYMMNSPRNSAVVRVVVYSGEFWDETTPQLPDFWVNILQGLAVIQPHDPDGPYQLFDMLPPVGVEDRLVWCNTVAERLDKLGLNAVVAPAWEDPKETQSLWLTAIGRMGV
jgi:hypothetical protein